MTRIAKMLLGLAGTVITCSIIAAAIPVPAMDIADLAQRSDLIVIGRLLSVTPKGARTIALNGVESRVQVMVGEIQVDQVLKGAPDAPQLNFEFDLPDSGAGFPGIAAMSYRMVFLKKTHAGYSFASDYYPSIVATPGIPPGNAGLLDNITHQLEAVVQESRNDISHKQEALYALRTMQTPSATAALQRALQQKSTDLRLIATAALLERNDISGLQPAEAALTKRPAAVPNYLCHNIAFAISHGVHDDRAIPVLSRLLRLPELETRRAAASALWHTHSAYATAALAAALYDQDFEVRFYGVIGLAELTGQSEWHPNMEVFHEDETRYLQHWRAWAQANYPVQQTQQ